MEWYKLSTNIREQDPLKQGLKPNADGSDTETKVQFESKIH